MSRRREKSTFSSHVDSLHVMQGLPGELVDYGYLRTYREFHPRKVICDDVVGRRDRDNPLFLEYKSLIPTRAYVSQTRKLPGGLEHGDDLLFNYRTITGTVSDTESYSFLPDLEVSDDEFVTRACAVTNPSNADFDTAVFAAELRDVPRLLSLAGATLSKFGANEYLKYQYGWKPLISDIKKLIANTDKLQRRAAQISRLQRSLTTKRRYDPPELRFVGENLSESDHGLAISHKWTAWLHRWAVVNWIPEPPENDITLALAPFTRNLAPLDRAKQALYGLNVDGNTLWQAMPWSWLIDWGYNASDFLQSKQNVVGAKVGSTCLMKHTIEVRSSEFVPGAIPPDQDDQYNLSISSLTGIERTERKERIVGIKPSISSPASVNLLGDLRKSSILGALGIQRLRRLPF